MKMDFGVCMLVFSLLWKLSSSLRCYVCAADQNEEYADKLCSHFNFSEDFIVECKESTMCYKKEITSSLESSLKIYKRGCALQRISGDQVHTPNGWRPSHKIYEVYDEGCEESKTDPDRITKKLECYCRGDLCNGTTKIHSVSLGLLITLGLIFLLK